MLTPASVREGIGWLSDMPNAPDCDPSTVAGQAWLSRLFSELAHVSATGEELTSTCRAMARKAGAFHPTPGQIAQALLERRIAVAKEERAHEWRGQIGPAPIAPREVGGGAQVPQGFGQRDQSAFGRQVVNLIERGHQGPEGGEPYVAAVLREEREQEEANARGEVYRPRRYGPSLVGGGSLGRGVRRELCEVEAHRG